MFKKKPRKMPQSEIAASSAMRGLVQRLSLGPHQPAVRIIAFIAARPREGTSTVARNYAMALASETNQKVLLIDAGPMAADRFRVYGIDAAAANSGIVDGAIQGKMLSENIHSIGQNVSVGRWMGSDENRGTAGQVIHNHGFWDTLLKGHDSLVIDAPSLHNSFDGVVVAAKADATVIVLESERTPQPVVEHLRNTLSAAGAKIAGIVMNKRRYYIPGRVYRKL